VHTSLRPIERADSVTRNGIRLTSAARTIADAAEAGTAPEQIELAVHQAIERALTTPKRLKNAIAHRNRRVQYLVEQALDEAMTTQ
jgi:hypothetical protein